MPRPTKLAAPNIAAEIAKFEVKDVVNFDFRNGARSSVKFYSPTRMV